MKQVTLKKNVSGVELVTANWLASEDFVNCPDIFIIENIFLRKKQTVTPSRVGCGIFWCECLNSVLCYHYSYCVAVPEIF